MTNSVTCDQFEAIVPRLLDEEIELSADMRAHRDGCEACRSLVADLRAIQAGAAALPILEPRRDLWSGIAARIEAPVVPLAGGGLSRSGHRQISWRAASVAAAVLVFASTAVTYQMTRQGQAVPTPGVGAEPPSSGKIILASDPRGEGRSASYDREIARLRAIVDSGRTRLDPATVALLERNLQIIDTAIVQCRDALATDPASRFLIESLSNAYQTKVKLLRIAAAASKG